MKHIINKILTILIIFFCFTFSANSESANSESKTQPNLEIDTSKSEITWLGKKVSGQHSGTIKIKSGKLIIAEDKLLSGDFVFDMNSISNNDIEEEKYSDKLDNHLKNEDFFNVIKFPEATFSFNNLVPTVIKSGEEIKIAGELKIKDITVPVEFPAKIELKDNQYVASAKTSIDRTKWNIKYNSKQFFDPQKLADKLIYDDVEIGIKLFAQKK